MFSVLWEGVFLVVSESVVRGPHETTRSIRAGKIIDFTTEAMGVK